VTDGYKCFACPRLIDKVGESEIAAGWNKFQGRAGIGNSKQSITVVHCPDHKAGFLDAIQKSLEKEIDSK
jgi:hypothetical protein